MRPSTHARLFLTATAVWAAFWVAGLPHYYQQYRPGPLVAGSGVLIALVYWLGWRAIARMRPEVAPGRSAWMAFYFTVPLAIYDALYCGAYLGHGAGFVTRYWYLSIFYVLPWLFWLPMGVWRSRHAAVAPR
ncbi:MAG TPA: hypothetical protein VK447_05270 [Myxococcaceae bacterium]|nr:hypothetical protein [Myxococcaceae bacterium]